MAMMETPLLLTSFLLRAADLYARKPLVSREATATFRYTYGDAYRRICRLANALRALGVQPGDRVATFAWNHHRHLELYFGIPGIGAVLHTVNIRLGPDHLAYILNHAEDRVLFADADLLPALEPLVGQLPHLRHVV
ncbi:MAG: AMP-binding protein, partial [Clostridia bacterium]|nr:AMP-binding protein [Clostridia bacterium]